MLKWPKLPQSVEGGYPVTQQVPLQQYPAALSLLGDLGGFSGGFHQQGWGRCQSNRRRLKEGLRIECTLGNGFFRIVVGMKGGGKPSASSLWGKGCREFGDPLRQAGTCLRLKQDHGVKSCIQRANLHGPVPWCHTGGRPRSPPAPRSLRPSLCPPRASVSPRCCPHPWPAPGTGEGRNQSPPNWLAIAGQLAAV